MYQEKYTCIKNVSVYLFFFLMLAQNYNKHKNEKITIPIVNGSNAIIRPRQKRLH